MRKLWSWFAASLLLASAAPASGATVRERTIVHTLGADGKVFEEFHQSVRLDGEPDLESWSHQYIYLDEHRRLLAVDAGARRPDGRKERVRRSDQDTLAIPDAGTLFSSAKYREIEFPAVPVGSELSLGYRLEIRPYFPAGEISLTQGEQVEALSVEVRGGGAAFRWRIDGPADGLKAEAIPGGVRISAAGLAKPDPPKLARGLDASGPVLRYAWGSEADWPAVARWFETLTDAVPRREEAVRSLARELAAGAASPRERLARLTDFVQQKVRYVAVEVGIGGYRPFPPGEVLANRWGDCKGKSFLLIDLLAEAGITAFPALILASENDAIDAEFPSPGGFNHLIVAIPAAQLATTEGDPIADGYLFVDPTLERGAGAWLHPLTQDQEALIVRPGEAGLVRTPVRPAAEASRLLVNLSLGEDGSGSGGAALALSGSNADLFLDAIATQPPEKTAATVRTLLTRLLPGVELGAVSWLPGEGPLPSISVSAAVKIANVVQGEPGKGSFVLPGFQTTPEPRHLADRKLAVVVSPALDEVTWKVHLPKAMCPPAAANEELANELGSFAQQVTPGDRTVTVSRRSELKRRWVAPGEVPKLRELALAEHRAAKRRIRLACAAPATGS